jgi:molybdopterin synthase sulfur carrier subunit
MIAVRLFAAAAEAVGADQLEADAVTVGGLREKLSAVGDDAARVVAQCAVLRAGQRLADSDALAGGDTVDVLPPFAGG